MKIPELTTQIGWRLYSRTTQPQSLPTKGLCSRNGAGRTKRGQCQLNRPLVTAFSGPSLRPCAFGGFLRFPSRGSQRQRAGLGLPRHTCLCVFVCAQACFWHRRDSAFSRPVMSPHCNGFDGIIIFWKNCRKLRSTP